MTGCLTDRLLSVPPGMCAQIAACEPRVAERDVVTCDPAGLRLGSGGGTAHVLAEGWRVSDSGLPFHDWIESGCRTVIHGGGQSRRLPAYAGCGKLFMPVPVYRWSSGQRLDQTLLDLQSAFLDRVRGACAPSARLLLASGDVLLHCEQDLPPLPDADVVLLGLWVRPEIAQRFGVLFCQRDDPSRLVTFHQKPSLTTIHAQGRDQVFMLDAGIWVLSGRAVECLMRRAGWQPDAQAFRERQPAFLDLYGEWGPALGACPERPDAEVSALTCAAALLDDGRFYHFGRSRDIIASACELQNLVVDQTRMSPIDAHPRQFILNTRYEGPVRTAANHDLWIENSMIAPGWTLASEHVLTGIPPNDWSLALEQGVCLDMVPLGERQTALRVYGIDDPFRGAMGDAATIWLGRPVVDWLAQRNLTLEQAGFSPDTDVYDAALFPLVEAVGALDPAFVAWLFSRHPAGDFKDCWLRGPRVSAAMLCDRVNLERVYAQRQRLQGEALLRMAANPSHGVFYRLDLAAAAEQFAAAGGNLGQVRVPDAGAEPVKAMHDRMFRSAVMTCRGDRARASEYEAAAFQALREATVRPYREQALRPHCSVLEDQIVWARSPVRLDLAGGWSDTPPYCIQHGGAVLNMAVDLNGQPPIQVFVRRCETLHIVIRSIDLGIEERLEAYPGTNAGPSPDSGFGIARAALALCGFDPGFNGGAYGSLREQLGAFGGGIELSMLAAVPKGSGLGTSSILGGTLLGALSDFCGLGRDRSELVQCTLALEQLLGSGGGWQDQVGGLLPGIKLARTGPGLVQQPTLRWVPHDWLEAAGTAGRFLLYYTGITRTARSILAGIVRNMFLNHGPTLALLDAVAANAQACHEAMTGGDSTAAARSIARSWQLNQRLDPGTNVPAVQAVLERCGGELSAAKLLGAGGGGYLLLMARSPEAAGTIRRRLHEQPPNAAARFVEMRISRTGLEVTRS